MPQFDIQQNMLFFLSSLNKPLFPINPKEASVQVSPPGNRGGWHLKPSRLASQPVSPHQIEITDVLELVIRYAQYDPSGSLGATSTKKPGFLFQIIYVSFSLITWSQFSNLPVSTFICLF